MRASEQRRSGRARIDSTAVRDQAIRGSNKGSQTLQLAEGLREWRPEKETEYEIRILPYLVTLPSHPDDREVGTLWYRRPYRVHFSVGGSDKAMICPKSFGKPCPICQEVDLLYKDGYEKNKKVIDNIKATRFCLFAALVSGVEGIVIFAWNESKFAEKLEKELKKAKPENLLFADSEEGRMLIVRTSMEEPGTKEFKAYLTTDRIDFEDAGDLKYLEDDFLDTIPKLDEICKQVPYEAIAKLFHGVEDEVEEGEAAAPETPAPRTQQAPGRAAAIAAATAASAPVGKPAPAPAEKPASAPAAKEPVAPPVGEVCVACNGAGKNSRGRLCSACGGTGLKPSVPANTPPPARTPAPKKETPAPAAAAPAASAAGCADEEW